MLKHIHCSWQHTILSFELPKIEIRWYWFNSEIYTQNITEIKLEKYDVIYWIKWTGRLVVLGGFCISFTPCCSFLGYMNVHGETKQATLIWNLNDVGSNKMRNILILFIFGQGTYCFILDFQHKFLSTVM